MNNENLTPFQPGIDERRNKQGRPKGSRNRSTVARELLSLVANYPDSVYTKLIEQYPHLEKETTIEEMMNIVQIDKAIRKGDTLAYNAVMDSAYGKPKQEFETSNVREVQSFKIGEQVITFE